MHRTDPTDRSDRSDRTEPTPASPQQLAARVIRTANRETPADEVLREVLRSEARLRREDASHVARAVFAYYRWRGWLPTGLPLSRQLAMTSELAARFATAPESFADPEITAAIPAWIRGCMDVSSAWLRAIQLEPRLWLRARPDTAAQVAEALGDCVSPWPEHLPDALCYRGSSDLYRHPAFQAGHFELQDLSSQCVGVLCAPKPGETWWDVCAGEGGKTLHLADQMKNRGVVWATDRARWRLDRLRLRAKRAGLFNIRWLAWAGDTPIPNGEARFDGVLVDAPCSGVGTWQRNPHARWTLRQEDIDELAAVQKRLLLQAATGLKRGGRLIYAVCTLTHAETVGVAQAVDALCPDLEPVIANLGPDVLSPGESAAGVRETSGSPSPTPNPHHRWIRPEDRGGNGMFVAVWRRK